MQHYLLAAEGLNKSFSGFQAIRDLNFALEKGELRTVIGPNGAGKTTFLDLITGRTKPDTGTLHFEETHDLLKMNEYQIYRLGIGRKFQTPSVFTEHTVYDNILLGLKGDRGVFRTIFSKLSGEDRDRIEQV
ncbi:MAG TPA: ATP-binding cassette domain-containing protein, partial [Haloferula sp.]